MPTPSARRSVKRRRIIASKTRSATAGHDGSHRRKSTRAQAARAGDEAVLLSCCKFSVVRREVAGRDGQMHPRDIVVHPGAAVVLPILPDGRIILIDQLRHTINRRLLELPAGTLDVAGEPPEECAARELEEETGYVARHLEPLCRLYPSPGILTEMIHAFVATGLELRTARPEATEDIILKETTLEEAISAVLDGRIVDAKTMIALMYYRLRQEAAG